MAENICSRQRARRGGVIDWRETNQRAEACWRGRAQGKPQDAWPIWVVGKQQLVEIAKALSKDVRLLILDEPTASLSESDSQQCWT